jgi:ATP-dependent Lon protease
VPDTYLSLPVLPLRDVVVFPHAAMPLLVGRAASIAALDQVPDGGEVLLVAQRDEDVAEPVAADLFRVGTIARVAQRQRLANGTQKVLVEGTGRGRVTRFTTSRGAIRATVAPFPFAAGDGSPDAAARRREALGLFDEYVALHRRLPTEVATVVQRAGDPERAACLAAAHVAVRTAVRQDLLEAPTLDRFVDALATILASEVELLKLERKIEDDVRGAVVQNQREFYLQEQLKAIHRELGHDDDELAELEARIEAKRLPDAAAARARREVQKLRRTPALSPEATVGRNHLDWLLGLPWTERTDDVVDPAHARRVLDEDHHGLDDVKDRIVDHIAVLALAGRLTGPILCLVGPPGVGKTSLGRSIARALGRRFVRVALGGVRDEAEIRGHRRTYIGALPGRILQGMRKAETVNPVFLLDEVDKLGADWRGDPSAALLEVLDPEQNAAFSDHYLEVDYDLSQVLFLTTANTLAGIPEPLRDRMEVIRLPGYVDQEKLAIARQHLVPRQLTAHGITPTSVRWDAAVLPSVLRRYTREAGVREFERRIARIARKLARERVERPVDGPDEQFVRVADLRRHLGVPPFLDDERAREDRVGVATGLAYTSVGGELLDLEVSVVPGRGRVLLTGTLGDVMKESASAALSCIRARAAALGLDPQFHRAVDIHLHIPEGATPKDGPSAGIAIATALTSALTGRAVRGDVAMTGEITLRGRVLPIGGLKEKAVAAHRHRVTTLVIPAGNAPHAEELPAEVRGALTVRPVATLDEVLALALRPATAPRRGRARGGDAHAAARA